MFPLGGRTVALLVALLTVTALGSGIATSQQSQTYVVEQGDTCTEVTPLTSPDQNVSAFYGYGADTPFSANTPIGIEERNDRNSTMFLYNGPEGLSLVVLNGGTGGEAGGAATLEFQGLPSDGEWVVKDDPENESVERWARATQSGVAVDWGWRDAWTDGGAYRGGLDGQFAIRIDPAFNEDAAIEPLSPGNVTQWRVLSDDVGPNQLRQVTLDMAETATIRTGTCR